MCNSNQVCYFVKMAFVFKFHDLLRRVSLFFLRDYLNYSHNNDRRRYEPSNKLLVLLIIPILVFLCETHLRQHSRNPCL